MVELIAVTLINAALAISLNHFHAKERKDLYNRLMARSLPEYQNATQEKPKEKKPNYIQAAMHKTDRDRTERL